ncbi:MAG: START domain-containing protein [Halioglobus sp.]
MKNYIPLLRAKKLTGHALITVLCCIAGTGTAAAAETPWQLDKDESGIQLYTRSVPGSEFLEVKVVARIDAPIQAVAQVLGDGNGCSAWRAMCKSSEVLKVVSDTERYVYLVLDMPWPLSDRDLVIHSVAQIDPEAKTVDVRLDSASDAFPVQDYVRAESSGHYQLKALNDAQVEFTYTLHTDIGGDLSPELINPRMAASSYDDVKRLQQLVRQ